MPKWNKEYQSLLSELSFDATLDRSMFAWFSIFQLNNGNFKVKSVSSQLKGAFQPLGDMAKDLVDTFKPYRSSWYARRDALQPLYGIINLFYGIAHLILLALVFLIYPIMLCFKVNSLQDYVEKFGHFCIGVASWLIYGVLMLVRGATRIATTPLMLIKMVFRAVNTLIHKYFREEKFLAETDASLQAKVKVTSQLLETQVQMVKTKAQKFRNQYKTIEIYFDELPKELELKGDVLYLVKAIKHEQERVGIYRLDENSNYLFPDYLSLEKLKLDAAIDWSVFRKTGKNPVRINASEKPELIQLIAWISNRYESECAGKGEEQEEILTEIYRLHTKYHRLTYKKKVPTQLGYYCNLVLAEDNLPTKEELIMQKKKPPLLIKLKDNRSKEISFYLCGLDSTNPEFKKLKHTNELETLDFNIQSKVLISPQHYPRIFKEIQPNKDNFDLETQEEVAYMAVKNSTNYRFSTKANAYLQLFTLASESISKIGDRKELETNLNIK